ncbi:hypothetical protein ACHAWF_011629 [Thalassiosira exigua]
MIPMSARVAPRRRLPSSAAALTALLWTAYAGAFAPASASLSRRSSMQAAASKPAAVQVTSIDDQDHAEWIALVDATGDDLPPVRKRVLEAGGGSVPAKGSTVEVEYAGTLVGERGWSINDVVACWLSNLQGLDHLAPAFAENEIDGSKLMDDLFFT